ncbi:hypothetical protein FN846DRAFT_912599 [Sphaerosporella brunnea]|uniref:Uncharacterized protein n=1 Tax=Sphaerosporella brunnea TaxID=1250544 RepID=A0A5J5EHI5_9PEZI|nr:hypothetical protein FN846DRAFT_912599 [Sphaerosporella brunnea]
MALSPTRTGAPMGTAYAPHCPASLVTASILRTLGGRYLQMGLPLCYKDFEGLTQLRQNLSQAREQIISLSRRITPSYPYLGSLRGPVLHHTAQPRDVAGNGVRCRRNWAREAECKEDDEARRKACGDEKVDEHPTPLALGEGDGRIGEADAAADKEDEVDDGSDDGNDGEGDSENDDEEDEEADDEDEADKNNSTENKTQTPDATADHRTADITPADNIAEKPEESLAIGSSEPPNHERSSEQEYD